MFGSMAQLEFGNMKHGVPKHETWCLVGCEVTEDPGELALAR
jgi:hypothetical protein